ncbi:MAG: chromosome segregation protein SMC, partial [Bdellovibrionales bacterium]|nr:chromosome segregation protein SMC [Bdellovibrionales bacterium]
DLELLENNRNILFNDTETKKLEVENLKDVLNEVSSRLYGLEDLQNSFEGFQEGVKNVMLWQRQRQEQLRADGTVEVHFQPVAEVVEVPAEYELVMEAALGTRLQLLLSQNQDESIDALNYLKENQSGRSSFFSGDPKRDVQFTEAQVKNEEGVNGLLSEIVSVPEKFKNQIKQILGSVVIVDSIRTALRLRPNYEGMTFVTMDGDTLSPDGVLTGGASESAESGVLKRRREIKELSQKREETAGKLALAQVSLEKLNKQLKSLDEQIEDSKVKSVEKERQIVALEKDYERAENELQNAEQALSRQQEQVNRQQEQIDLLKEQLIELKEKITEVKSQREELEKSVNELTEELLLKKSGIDSLQEEVAQLRVDSSAKRQELENLLQQMDRVQDSLNEVNEQLQQMSAETQKSTESLSENQVLLEQARVNLEKMIAQTKEVATQLSELKDEYELQAKEVRELESQVSDRLHQRNDYKSRMNESQLKLEQLKMKEQYLVDQINERYMKDLRLVANEFKDVEGDVSQTENDIEELRSKLKRIGEVNLSAIEEYNELIDRYEFLKQQHEDLISAKDQLRKVIDRINRICSRRFKDTFEQVNERFMKVFPVLFGGGMAKLILVEDPEKGEMGIDIVAQPPGKKPANVSLLSGGEKALTAVSLIFSIFLVKPSPFCLLDEVDAPLDDANVHRFNDLVKEMAKRSQIIIVTHNKHTMKVNKKLFGVTQEEKGVSKMVSVSLAEAQQVVD